MNPQLYIAAQSQTWAILPSHLSVLMAYSGSERRQAAGMSRRPEVRGTVAVLPMHGVISQRDSVWSQMFGGTSTESFGSTLVTAAASPHIRAIVIDVDSPGGTVAGVEELADLIRQVAKSKPLYAVANSLCASAAYWLASQVGKGFFFAAPGAEVGSIGVFRMHEDHSEALRKEGIRVQFISAGKYKTEANPYEPLTDEAKKHHLEQVNLTYNRFVNDVARGRGLSAMIVGSRFGEGRMFDATQGHARDMVDGVRSLAGVLALQGVNIGLAAQGATSASMRLERELAAAWRTGETSAEYRTRTLTKNRISGLLDSEGIN